MFDFAEITNDMSEIEILNYYRNLYYTEPQVTERGIVANAINDMLDFIDRQKAEIERLLQKLQQAKSEAIKEFAEKLKKRFYLSAGRCVVDVYHIDNLLKEMVGEEK